MPDFDNKKTTKIITGPIAVFAKHPTAANLIMVLMIIAGVWGIIKMNSQFLPSFGIDIVVVTIEWPGANSEDIDTNIVQLVDCLLYRSPSQRDLSTSRMACSS